jgi:hypothetical protein
MTATDPLYNCCRYWPGLSVTWYACASGADASLIWLSSWTPKGVGRKMVSVEACVSGYSTAVLLTNCGGGAAAFAVFGATHTDGERCERPGSPL